MAGIGSILNMARQGMDAQQLAIQVASQNISNASTQGYSRQTIQLASSDPTVFPYGSVGTGVSVESITRSRDALLDSTYRSDAAGQSAAETTSNALSQIQSVFGEPSTTGLSATLNAFWSSWSDLANDPTNSAAKAVVLSAGGNVATTLNQDAAQLSQLDLTNRQGITTDVGTVNKLAQQVADLNVQIVSAQSNGTTANDLADQRDNLLDQLSQLTGGQVVQRQNGASAFYVGGTLLVDGATVQKLQFNDAQPPSVSVVGNSGSVDGIGGQLGAELDVSATQIPTVMSNLNSLASGIVQTVNAIHSTGQTYSGTPPVASPAGNFFDVTNPPPAGGDPLLTAAGIRVSPTLTSPDDVAAAGPTATGPGNNDVANELANLASTPVTFTSSTGATIATTSIGQFFQSTISNLATATQNAQDNATVQGTLASNADTQRQSVSGVSTDDELISVIQHQNAYQAAARLVDVVDQMAASLIEIGSNVTG